MIATKALARTIARWLLALSSLRPVPGVLGLPRYLSDWRRYRRQDRNAALRWRDSYPCLTDWTAKTPFDPHYFYQAAWLARRLADRRPDRHVDIGSSVNMHGVLSAFVPTTFVDYRPLTARVTGFNCIGADITRLPFADRSLRSLSCLHVIEHIGLGRYGDPINAMGSQDAAKELQRVIAANGRFYLSVPVGRERVCFNAHRVFSPATIVAIFNSMKLVEFSFVGDDGAYQPAAAIGDAEGLEYGCGMFLFESAVS